MPDLLLLDKMLTSGAKQNARLTLSFGLEAKRLASHGLEAKVSSSPGLASTLKFWPHPLPTGQTIGLGLVTLASLNLLASALRPNFLPRVASRTKFWHHMSSIPNF